MDQSERNFALKLAKDSLLFFLEHNSRPTLTDNHPIFNFPKESEFFKPRGCFVTLKAQGHLRGCIGTVVSEEELFKNIINNAILSGLNDPRFSPVELSEFESLDWEISIMGPVEKMEISVSENPEIRGKELAQKIEIGKHGLIVKRGKLSGLLLPQVAVEYQWNAEKFLSQTCVKAGLRMDSYLDPQTEIYWFSAEVFS
jgi:uncharacterized protein